MLQSVKRWYSGQMRPYENAPDSQFVIMGGYTDYHWTALVARAIVEFYLKHWQWVWGTAIAISGLAVAISRLKP